MARRGGTDDALFAESKSVLAGDDGRHELLDDLAEDLTGGGVLCDAVDDGRKSKRRSAMPERAADGSMPGELPGVKPPSCLQR